MVICTPCRSRAFVNFCAGWSDQQDKKPAACGFLCFWRGCKFIHLLSQPIRLASGKCYRRRGTSGTSGTSGTLVPLPPHQHCRSPYQSLSGTLRGGLVAFAPADAYNDPMNFMVSALRASSALPRREAVRACVSQRTGALKPASRAADS